ncbi:MAG: hypothetical protein ACTSRS_12465 [Candidatus Helarchaeota archaeon]
MASYRLPSKLLLQREFQNLQKPVTLSLFLKETELEPAEAVISFLQFIAEQNAKISLKIYSQIDQPHIFAKYNIQESPAIVLENSGIKYTAVPAGPESIMFVKTIVMLSTQTTGIGDAVSKIVTSLSRDVALKTIITSDCTVCPLAVKIGNMLTLESNLKGNGKLQHEIIDSLEHESYVSAYDISAVPLILINDSVAFNGIPNLDQYLLKIAEAGK